MSITRASCRTHTRVRNKSYRYSENIVRTLLLLVCYVNFPTRARGTEYGITDTSFAGPGD